MLNKQTAIFLDRDGTIIVDKNYLKFPSDVELLSGSKEAIQLLKTSGCMLFLFSNQSGISRNLLTMDEVEACNKRMIDLLSTGSETFQEICIAPELPEENPIYRKPSPRFILEMIKKYSLTKNSCYMVGDKESDVLAGINAGINSILISDETQIKPNSAKNFQKFHSILKFSNWLLKIK